MYFSVSCMKPMFHLKPKPSPPSCTGCETFGQAVEFLGDRDDAGMVPVDGAVHLLQEAHRLEFSRPPYSLGIHSPCLRE